MAVLVVFGTFNPSGSSFYHWVIQKSDASIAFKSLVGLLLLVGWVVCFRATARSLGKLGVSLAVAVLGVMVWILIDKGFIGKDQSVLMYSVLVIVSLVLTLGMTGSFLWRRLTGQYHVSEDGDGDE